MDLICILLAVVILIFNDCVYLGIIALHQIYWLQAVAGNVSLMTLAVVLIFHVELRKVVLSVDDRVASIIVSTLLLVILNWVKVVVSAVTISSFSDSIELIWRSLQLS